MAGLTPEMQALLKTMEARAQAAFIASVERMTGAAQINALTVALEARDVDAVMRLLNLDATYFAALDRAIRDTFEASGDLTLLEMPPIRDPLTGSKIVLGFNGRHYRAETWTRLKSSELIQGINADTIEGVRAYVAASIETGRAPRSTALDIVGRVNRATGRREGGIIGLNAPQVDAVMRARAELSDPALMSNYFTRKRRDTRFDGIVRRAMEAGKSVAAADIDRIIGRYNDRLLKLRGETIARTEALNAQRAGRHEGWQQVIDSGAVRADQVQVRWQATGDARTRDTHLAMNGQKVKFGALFISPSGAQMEYPGDVTHGAPGSEIIACRCTGIYRILPRT